ncbi:toxin-antitoxin system, toxin component, RelE/ParE family (plasmid) [Candidatus Campylobacter infans]|jgi:phage-related protein|uniref:Toxin-antitoxin system, toxin component, RelE/ParE family n=1 Tax=Candidatus Campylobacter infans TaxID=2561898 RepID=A0A7H9CNB5_9BACT|nr:type II toxin-antitoxin system RelE/ParE family toxin [Candidatus Campylobacter infans]QLI06229.1 toxin-antitoxin system, toxin component, RelE/ParE family [Candidatus Campylobacter infans]
MKKIQAKFYQNTNGKEPVKEWLLELSKDDRIIIGKDIAVVEYGFPIGMPVCRSLGGSFYEVRSNISSNRIARVIFTIKGDFMILLHGFIKKTQKTPLNELNLAKLRAKEIQ